MQLSKRLLLFLVLFLVSAAATLLFARMVAPESASPWQFAIFYALTWTAVFAAIAGVASAAGSRGAARRGILLGFLTVVALVLQASSLLSLWTGLLLLLIFTLIEIYAIAS